MASKAKSWEKLPDETGKAYEAFCIYRDMGIDRSIHKVALKRTESGPHTSRLKEWSRKYHWILRATAYDEHLDDIRRFRNEEALVEMSERHAREAQLLQEKAITKLKALNIDDMKPFDVIKFYDTAVKIERLSRGVPTENIKQEKEFREVKNDAITRESLQKPEIRKKANQLIRAVADSQGSTDGVGTNSK